MRFAIVVATFYEELAQRLVGGAERYLEEAGLGDGDYDLFKVPGCFELPLAAKAAASSGRYDGVICLGAVIKGETDHYEYVSTEAARGIQRSALETGVPCSFGVLTCATMEQALERTGGGKRDQGYNAARSAASMAEFLSKLR